MAEQDDAGQDQGTDAGQTDGQATGSTTDSGVDYAAEAKRFQSLADKRDAENKTLKGELDALKAAQEAAQTKELEDQKKYEQLYKEQTQKLTEAEAARAKLALSVALQNHLSEHAPDYAADLKWIAPHVTSEADIASVTEAYMKAHPKTAGMGTASAGNRGSAGDGQKTVSQADLSNPATYAKLLEEEPHLDEKLASGEIKII